MSNPAANLALNSLNCLTGIELTKPLILTERPLVSGVAVSLVTDSGGGGGGGILMAPNGTVYALSVDTLITTPT